MIIGICEVKLRIYSSNSLKYKRQIIKSIIERLRSRYNISIAEIADNDLWQTSTIGFSCVSNSKQHVDSIIGRIINFIENDNRVEILATEIEIL